VRLFAEISPDLAAGGTISGSLNVAPSSNTANDLLLVTEPAGYAANSNTGNALRITDGTVDVLLVDAYGGVKVKAPSGQGDPTVRLSSVDHSSAAVEIQPAGLSFTNDANTNWLTASPVQFALASAVQLGFFGAPAVSKPTVTGAKLPSDTVMASLLTALVALGLVTNSTT
jgi:hypothetical protein